MKLIELLSSWRCLAVILVSGSVSLPAAESLAVFAPAETALFVEVPNPDATWDAFDASPLAARWQETRLAKLWLRSRFVERWRALDQFAVVKTGQPLTRHLRRLFADGVAVAVVLRDRRPLGVLVARAKSAEDVLAAVRAWDQLEPPLRVETRQQSGRSYVARTLRKPVGEQTIYYAVDGPRFLLSDHEELLCECLAFWPREKLTSDSAAKPLAQEPAFDELQSAEAVACRLFIAPARWRTVLQALSDGTPASNLVLDGLGQLQGVRATLTLEQGVFAEIAATLDRSSVTTRWRDFANQAQPPSILETAPDDALLVAGARCDTAPLIEGFARILPERDRDDWEQVHSVLRTLLLGLEPWNRAVPAVLSDWGGYVALRPADEQQPPRSHPFVAVSSGQLPDDQSLTAGLENAVTFGVNALAAAMMTGKQGTPVALQRRQSEAVHDWLITGRTAGELAVRLTGNRWILATSRAELERTALSQSRPSPSSQLTRTAAVRFPGAAAFFWWNARRTRSSLAGRALQVWTGGKEPPPLAVANELSTLFDELFAALRLDESRISLQAGGVLVPER